MVELSPSRFLGGLCHLRARGLDFTTMRAAFGDMRRVTRLTSVAAPGATKADAALTRGLAGAPICQEAGDPAPDGERASAIGFRGAVTDASTHPPGLSQFHGVHFPRDSLAGDVAVNFSLPSGGFAPLAGVHSPRLACCGRRSATALLRSQPLPRGTQADEAQRLEPQAPHNLRRRPSRTQTNRYGVISQRHGFRLRRVRSSSPRSAGGVFISIPYTPVLSQLNGSSIGGAKDCCSTSAAARQLRTTTRLAALHGGAA